MIEVPFANMEDICVTANQDINNDDVKIIKDTFVIPQYEFDDIENNEINDVENNKINDVENNEINDIENNEINDIENNEINDVESNQINECVICFDPVTNACEISKFGCVHSKYMHENCVKSLRKCPLCRETSIIVETSARREGTWAWQQHVICFLIGCFFGSLMFILTYPMIFFSFGNYNPKVNSTMYNDTIHNDTYTDSIYRFN